MRPKIFAIGFNRCGTLSLHKLFKRNGLTSVHYNTSPSADGAKNILPTRILANLSIGRPLLHGMDQFDAYSDLGLSWPVLTFEAARLFRDLHRDYPDAYFILNTRPVDSWIASRLMHLGGDYAERYMAMYGCDRRALIDLWAEQFSNHHADVQGYFKDCGTFLTFDIEEGDPSVLCEFLSGHYDLKAKHWGRSNETQDFIDNPELRRQQSDLILNAQPSLPAGAPYARETRDG